MIRFYKDLINGHTLELIEVNLRTNMGKFEDLHDKSRNMISTSLSVSWLKPLGECA